MLKELLYFVLLVWVLSACVMWTIMRKYEKEDIIGNIALFFLTFVAIPFMIIGTFWDWLRGDSIYDYW